MDHLKKSWYEAIFERQSRRSYSAAPPEEEKLIRIEKTCREFRPFGEARAEIVQRPPDRVFKGAIGSYGKITGAPAYLAFIGKTPSAFVQERVGYTAEGIVLEATSLGLGTCWVAGFFRPEAVESDIKLAEDEKILAVSPVGYATQKYSFTDRTFKRFVSSGKRKAADGLILSGGLRPSWVIKGLEAARLAPSAMNRQPWRFSIEEGAVTISIDSREDAGKISKRLDCGIAMLHLELAAFSEGVKGRWEFLETPQVARFIFS